MFGKILGQEFRNTWKIPVGMTFFAIVTSIFARLLIEFMQSNTYRYQAPSVLKVTIGLALFLYVISMLATNFLLMFSMPLRFYKESFSNMGYLYNALPISKSSFFASHIIVSGLWVMEYVAVTVVCIYQVFIRVAYAEETMIEIWRFIFRELKLVASDSPVFFTLTVIVYAVTALAAPFIQVIIMNFSVCLGQIFQKHRGIMAVVMYFVVGNAIEIINGTVYGVMAVSSRWDSYYETADIVRNVFFILLVNLAVMLVEAVIMWLISVNRMEKHLNLE